MTQFGIFLLFLNLIHLLLLDLYHLIQLLFHIRIWTGFPTAENINKSSTSKSQLFPNFLSETPNNFLISFDGSMVPTLNAINIFGTTIMSNIS